MKNFIICMAISLGIAIPIFAKNEKPFVIPEIKEWQGEEGYFIPGSDTKIIIAKDDEAMKEVGILFSEDLKKMFGLEIPVIATEPQPGDIVLNLNPDIDLGDEGYEIKIGDKVVIKGPKAIGVYWGTRTLLQMAEGLSRTSKFTLPRGEVRDEPEYALRGFSFDVARKYIPLEVLEDYIDVLSYYKMNFFQLHLNDNGFPKYFDNDWNKTYSAFRLESDTYPGLTAEDGFYKKEDFREFQKKGVRRFVEVMPEIDVPAHSLAFTKYKPEIGSAEYGMDHLDITKEETYEFLDGLFAEYLEGEDPVFVGPRVSIGTDEYSNRDSVVVEKFRYLTDRYIKYVESFGKKAGIWGALTHAKGKTPVKSEDVLMNVWYNGYADPKEMIEAGYEIVSIPDDFVYIVPAAGYYNDYLDTEFLYKEWTPANINGEIFEERHPSIKGGMFAVWNDIVGNGITVEDIHDRVIPALQTIAAKTWSGKKVSLPYEDFDAKRREVNKGLKVQGL